MIRTETSFEIILNKCLDVFLKKNQDYGTSWRVLRPPSLTDQILIKASRIRSIDEKGEQKVNDPIELEFYGLINYSVMALIQMELINEESIELSNERLKSLYEEQIQKSKSLLSNKNHDYGEVWRMMRLSSIIDIILMKVHRIIKIEDNQGKTLISEGIDANYLDIINYCVFSLIKLEESKS
jgi:hypothetical protein